MHAPDADIIQSVKSWKPLSDRIVILPDVREKETESGILYADTKLGENKRQAGLVLCCGLGRASEHGVTMPVEVKPGDRVLFKKYAGDDLLVNADGTQEGYVGEPPREDQALITIVRQESILAILP